MTSCLQSCRKTGLSLVEVMMAIVIFAFAVIPIIGLFGRGTTYTQTNADFLAAMHSSSGYLRSLMGLPFRDVPLGIPVELDKTYGSSTDNQIHIPSSEVINGNTFSYRLHSKYVTRTTGPDDFFFSTMTAPGESANFSMYKRFVRLEMEVRWKSKMSGKTEIISLFVYKAELG
ncbi:MAG: type IV pilus modification PilV family protein [Candidatus Rifleibacteriota bacterium]